MPWHRYKPVADRQGFSRRLSALAPKSLEWMAFTRSPDSLPAFSYTEGVTAAGWMQQGGRDEILGGLLKGRARE